MIYTIAEFPSADIYFSATLRNSSNQTFSTIDPVNYCAVTASEILVLSFVKHGMLVINDGINYKLFWNHI